MKSGENVMQLIPFLVIPIRQQSYDTDLISNYIDGYGAVVCQEIRIVFDWSRGLGPREYQRRHLLCPGV